jgi:hypothetical protein
LNLDCFPLVIFVLISKFEITLSDLILYLSDNGIFFLLY